MAADLSAQTFGFLAFLILGAVFSALYDVLRIWRALFRSERRSVFFQDFFYMLLASLGTFLVFLGVSGGEIRLYLLAGELLGWLVWHFTLGLVTVSLFRRLARFLYRHVFDPMSVKIRQIGLKLQKSIARLASFVKKHMQNGKKRLKHRAAIVYNRHNGTRSHRRNIKPGKARRNMKVMKGKKRRKSVLLRIAIFAFTVYAIALLVNQQVSIAQKKQQLAEVKQQIQIQEIQNDDLHNAVTTGKDGNSEYMERAAREGLDYAKPGERIFVNIAGK